MPFERFTPLPFTAATITGNVPSVPGVYGLSNPREWIYVGETTDIRASLLAHLRDLDSPIMRRSPKGFVFEACHPATCAQRRGRLAHEYHPACHGEP